MSASIPNPGPPQFVDADLRGARITGCTLEDARITGSDVNRMVMRGVWSESLEIDSPWFLEGEKHVWVNGVDVLPYVDAELDRRFPGRGQRTAADPQSLRDAWATLESTWAAALARVEDLPAGTPDVEVDGEWSFAQTLRHLVMATDTWLNKAVLDLEQPFHPIGLADTGTAESSDVDVAVFTDTDPTYTEVLEARAERVAMVRDFLATLTDDLLAEARPDPHDPADTETVLSCVQTILEEEWEHHRYAVRDLDAIT